MSIASNNHENNKLTVYLKRFLEWSSSMNYSPHTIKHHDDSLRRFIVWCEQRDLVKPQEITKQILERYRKHLYYYRQKNGEPLSFSTQHGRLASLKAFFKWLSKENHILFNPAVELELPKIPKHLPKNFLSEEEIEEMLNQTGIFGDAGVRDRAIMETFYSTGIRKSELANLRVHDINLQRGTLVIFEGKFQRDRIVPIGDRACAWVRKYMEEVRPKLVQGKDDGILFLTDSGKPFLKSCASDMIKKYMRAVGIDKPGACHLFRHSMATHMLDNGADIRYIQTMLGHVNLTTTQIYTQVSIKKLKEVHAATHPARMK